MSPLDPFTQKRLLRSIEEHRSRTGQLPTYQDLEALGFGADMIKAAKKDGLIIELFVTLTNGSVVKGFKQRL